MAVGLETLPLGFRFRPTDQELVNHYLKGKIEGRMESDAVIPEVDVCKCEPWDLPDKSLIKSDDLEWFFFSPKDRKYPNGPRANRATEAGYWKATGKDRTIKSRLPQTTVIGKKKTLVFYRGRAPRAVRTNWVMHEYSTAESEPKGRQTGFVLYRLFKKPEENYQSSNADEIGRNMNELENSRSSPTSARFSPVEDQTGAEEEFAATLNHNLPESELQQNLQSVPDSYAYQTTDTDGLLADIGDSARMFPVRPDENHSNSNMTYNIGEPEEEVTEQDGCHLNEFAQFLGQEYAQVGSYELPRIDSPWLDYLWFSSYDVVEQGLNTCLTQDNTVQQDLVTELLDAVLSNEEVDSRGTLNNQTDVVSTALPEGQPCMITDNFIKESEMSGDVDIESLISQGYGDSMFVGGSTEDSCHRETKRQLEFVGTGNSNNFSDSMEESTSQVNFDRRITVIRKHEHLPAIDNLVAQQGSAVRRLRLQNCIQVGTESTKDHLSSKELEKEGEEYIENCNAEERIFLGSPLDTVEGIYSHDGVAIPASSETSDGCKPILRMRRNRLARDVDEVKGSSSQPVKPRSPSPYAIRMGVLFSAILLFLCLGISWYISSRYAI